MHPLLIGILALLGLCVAFVAWRYFATIAAGAQRTADIKRRIDAVLSPLNTGGQPELQQLRVLAEDPATRNMLRESLNALNHSRLFPAEYATEEAMAESELVFWLRHPNELGDSPNAIELMERQTRPYKEGVVAYYVFRYRTHPPHWAANQGWLAGVAGPYPASVTVSPEVHPTAFSAFKPYAESTPTEHIDWYHDMLSKRGMLPS
jgi:hypothetical protein